MAARTTWLVAALAIAAAGCEAEAERHDTGPAESLVVVRELRVGPAVDESGAVVAPADSFGPRDTVYASMAAQGNVDRVLLAARWTRADDVLVSERQEAFPLEGRRTVTFRLADPAGLPVGEYRVEIRLAGTDVVGGEEFRVVDTTAAADRTEETGP